MGGINTDDAVLALYCGDPHGRSDQIIDAACAGTNNAVVILGSLDPTHMLNVDLNDQIWYIPGVIAEVWHAAGAKGVGSARLFRPRILRTDIINVRRKE